MSKCVEEFSHTVAMPLRDYVEWHKNREHYAVWVIDFDEPAILKEIDKARHFFKDILLKPFERQPHISLFVSGFLSEQVVYDDDYSSAAQLVHQQALLESQLNAFDIEIGAINSFDSALYFEVIDHANGIERTRNVLGQVMPELRWKPYVPHITLGVYKDTIPIQAVMDRINEYQRLPKIQKHVRDIKLVTYQATELLGPLTTRFTYTFK